MTLSLFDEASAVLSPETLLLPDHVLDYIDRHAVTHGVYGWWFDYGLPLVPRDGCIERDGKHLLYIGIAPPKDRPVRRDGSTPVKSRLWRNHLRGTVRTSTLRLSLAALLEQELELTFWRDKRNRVRMDRHHEDRLSDWTAKHAAISVVQHDEPWSLEEALVRTGPPLPLNLSMSGHPFRSTLSDLRRVLGRK
ncbi:GIY-YIG nuclease family protein [Marivita sp. S0852]|uniref:GIY-YIG nuclease family protein n=1 Tax=Marivita sp. S0852 TaxID=3373893 RepID=UPI0039829609